uniref:26S proteasome non-ATPase regulatory subunit 6 n=1 Tax=Sinocyclocheilus rhinocerous TaxID=307959 RepID=A0A673KFZ1_9TELE
MPLENLEEEGLPKNPNLRIAQLKFSLALNDHRQDAKVRSELMDAIKLNNMAPYYEALCKELKWQVDTDLLSKMKKANEDELKRLDDVLEDAEKNQGESEIRDAMMAKAEYLIRIGDKEGALTAFRKTYDKTVALGHRLDIVFYLLRIGLFYMDNDLITRNTEKAKSLIEEGGDWDRRNRLKVYQGLYCVAIRDFKQAAELFLDTVSTFTSYELMDYKTFVTYTVYVCMIALKRPDLREKVIKGAEILEVLHSLPAVRQYLFSLYECRYSVFFQSLARVEQEMKQDWLFAPHYRYYVREMDRKKKIKIYTLVQNCIRGFFPKKQTVFIIFDSHSRSVVFNQTSSQSFQHLKTVELQFQGKQYIYLPKTLQPLLTDISGVQ